MIPYTDNSAHITDDFCTERRLEETIRFLNAKDFQRGPVLDVGGVNYVGQRIFTHLGKELGGLDYNVICNTPPGVDFNDGIGIKQAGDFSFMLPHGFRAVLCLEVFEHVMNPLLFMRSIREVMAQDGVLYLSTPVKHPFGFMFNETNHFTEYKVEAVQTCLSYAGFKEIKVVTFPTIPFWEGMRRGGGLFRTYFRVRFQETMLVRAVRRGE